MPLARELAMIKSTKDPIRVHARSQKPRQIEHSLRRRNVASNERFSGSLRKSGALVFSGSCSSASRPWQRGNIAHQNFVGPQWWSRGPAHLRTGVLHVEHHAVLTTAAVPGATARDLLMRRRRPLCAPLHRDPRLATSAQVPPCRWHGPPPATCRRATPRGFLDFGLEAVGAPRT